MSDRSRFCSPWFARGFALLTAVALAAAGAALLAAAEPTAKPNAKAPAKPAPGAKRPADTPSLDEQLLQDLDNDLLPAGEQPRAREKKAGEKKPGGSEGDKPGEGAKPEDAGEDIGQSGEQDPLTRICDKMREAEELIERQKSPQRTEELQRQIVSDLAKLIDEMKKHAQQQKSGAKQEQQTASREQVQQPKSKPGESKPSDSSQPAMDSTDQIRKNDPRRPDMAAMHELMKDVWGQLPQHDREQMSQSAPEQFLPKYELLIEKYYKRLAEQQKDRP